MKTPRFTLVRESTMADSLSMADYLTGAEAVERREEVLLESPSGEPCCHPVAMPIRDIDYKHKLSNGDESLTLRGKQRDVVLAIDYIGSGVRNRLERLMNQRAKLRFTPVFGRDTTLGFRPLDLLAGYYRAGGAATDDTERNLLESVTPSDMLYWDRENKVFLGKFTSNASVVSVTPGGAGVGGHRDVTNRWIPSYPEGTGLGGGAGASKCGWYLGGADLADITLTYIANGFGHSDAPNSLRVQTNTDVATDRYLYQSKIWDSGDAAYLGASPSGAGMVVMTIWVKGRFPLGATFNLSSGGASVVTVTPADLDTSEWTPIVLSRWDDNWSTGNPSVTCILPASTAADTADFEIGPMFCSWAAHMNPVAMWIDQSDGASGELEHIVTGFVWPPSGTIFCSMFMPDEADITLARFGMCGSDGASFTLMKTGASEWTLYFRTGTFDYTAVLTSNPNLGKVNTFTFTWGNGARYLYANGDVIGSWITETDFDLPNDASVHDLTIGTDALEYSVSPCSVLSLRVDEKVWDAEECAKAHATAADPGSVASILPTRGRTYRITSIPSSPRSSPGGTQWIGKLTLRQVSYSGSLADKTIVEESNV